jgi:hypothetical protein
MTLYRIPEVLAGCLAIFESAAKYSKFIWGKLGVAHVANHSLRYLA